MKHRLFLFLLFVPLVSFSQQRNSHQLSWFRLTLADTITKKVEVEVGIQRRTQNNYHGDANIFHSFQFEGYTATLEYSFTDKLSASIMPLGYYRSHMLNVLPSDYRNPCTTEWRTTAQVMYQTKLWSLDLSNRIGVDYRRREFPNRDHFEKNWRLRYMIRFDKEVFGIFSDTKPVTFTLFDEVFFQFGDAVNANHTSFDQHRLYIGAAYEVFKNTSLTLGYAYGFQIRPSADQRDDINSYYVALTFENFISQFARPKVKKRST
ncbi:MAG TPA: DUF2490 domain-containing protein [Chryseolinea sp.]|nr:DUF2490 domain-containing protein [Chryseolinea sp.]